VWTVPPDCTPAFVDEMIARGFTRIEDEPVKPKKAKA